MEKKLIEKMIKQSFAQYDIESAWLNERQHIQEIYEEVISRYKKNEGEIYELIEDAVYEFVTA